MKNITIIGNIPTSHIVDVFNKILNLGISSINNVSTLDRNNCLLEFINSFSSKSDESEYVRNIHIYLNKEKEWKCSVNKFSLKRDFCDYLSFLENY